MPGWIASAIVSLALLQAPAPISVRDLDGRTSTPLSPAAGTVHLLFFVNAECPISSRYSPEIDRITAEYGKRGVRTWLVYADPKLTTAAARANLKAFHPAIAATAVIDANFTLTKAVDAMATPEAAVYTSRGRVYRGRIDDWYQTIGQQRRAPTQRDLRVALDAVLDGKPVPTPETTPVGCFIERK
jgi:hypothetical protein